MADFLDQAADILETVAPTVATAFGGPLAGQAVQFIEKALGLTPSGSMDDRQAAAAQAIVMATPDQMLALKKMEVDFQTHMADLGVELEKMAAGDRDSARKREVEVKDRTPAALALLLTAGFFGVLATMIWHGLPKDTAGSEAMLTMLGSLGTAWIMAMTYYFGSSSGSEAKNRIIASLTPPGPPKG